MGGLERFAGVPILSQEPDVPTPLLLMMSLLQMVFLRVRVFLLVPLLLLLLLLLAPKLKLLL